MSGTASRSRRGRRLALVASLAFAVSGCGDSESDGAGERATLAFVTNGKYAFWEPAHAGVVKAGQELGVEVLFRTPENNMNDQKQVLEDLLNLGVDGIAVSVIDPVNQRPLLDRIAARVPLVTHDSDAPDSQRACFVGVDNYVAGTMAGELCRKTLPDGGKIALFVGNLSQDNARLRRQGFIDVVLGRAERTPIERIDPTDATLEGGGFTIVGTYTDDGDRSKAKANVEDALNRHPDLAGVVGFFQYNAPACLNALRAKDRVGSVAVFGFDEHEDTLAGIAQGEVAGTVVQNPYEYGYQSVRLLVALVRGERGALPDGGVLDVPARTIDGSNVEAFRAELREQMSVLEGSGSKGR